MTIRLLIFTFFLFTFNHIQAQHYYFNHYKVEDGVSNNTIICSAQDQDGFMWFGTKDGLNRFDGYRFKHFFLESNRTNSLVSNFIHSLLVRSNKELWVGTDQGIYIFNPYEEKFTAIENFEKGEILSIQEDEEGNIWFISNNRLYQYIANSHKIISKTPHFLINAFCIDKLNQVWVGTNQKIINIANSLEYHLPIQKDIPNRIERLYADETNDIWIGTSKKGVFRWNRNSKTITNLIETVKENVPLFVRDIKQISPSEYWLATESGLIIYNSVKENYHILQHEIDNPWSVSDNALYTITKDHQGGIWIGSFFGGINYYHNSNNLFEKIFPRFSTNSLQGHAVREIVEDNFYNIWIGTEDNGLSHWNPRTNEFKHFNLNSNLAHTNIHGLAIIGDSLLVGTFDHGMNVIDVKSKKVIKYFDSQNTNKTLSDNFIFHIYKTAHNRILIATSRGLFEFYPGKDTFKLVESAPSHIFYTSIFQDKDQNIWLSTWRDGLLRLSNNQLTTYRHNPNDSNSISSNRINKVFQDSDNNIWIATEIGLCKWNKKSDTFQSFTKKNGLPSNLILAIQEDNRKNLWISSTNGLIRLNTEDLKIKIYNQDLGILTPQFNYNSTLKDSKGLLYFGSSKGLIRFAPHMINDDFSTISTTPIYITGIQTHQKELSIGRAKNNLKKSIIYTDKIELEHDESTISLEFAALNYTSAKSTSYRYRLLGLDTTWTFTRNSTKANFTKIPSGSYTFQVQAVDANGDAISVTKSLQVIIHPSIWASLPAKIIYLLLLFSTLVFIIIVYDRRIKEKNRKRLEIIKAHKEQEIYKAKMNFFMSITHEIKTPLTLIRAPIERLQEDELPPEKRRNLVSIIYNNTEKLVRLTDKLLDFRKTESSQFSLKLEKKSINKLVRTCIQEYQTLIERKSIKLTFSATQEVEASIDVEAVYKIIDNLLSNAIKYSERRITIELNVISDPIPKVRLVFKNDGILLSEKEIKSIFKPFHRSSEHYQIEGSGLGLALANSFATLHGGSLFFEENKEKLNIFVLQLPV
ncbi:ligand-binding sensor domain-containing protein [Sphingobacterium composti Ten et al. 2007 non Yoo et al. 2007]|uniref:ligand-binding sensor domain-containing protein n=1 Tax=Sphingobacterium composti TaxID=363260 RepID=UPI00135AB66D|nr:two-component regulator propeller domain-containing protein [Sphingobacterium composti Ten et al. 2007 non Yoo et al. 2007]